MYVDVDMDFVVDLCLCIRMDHQQCIDVSFSIYICSHSPVPMRRGVMVNPT